MDDLTLLSDEDVAALIRAVFGPLAKKMGGVVDEDTLRGAVRKACDWAEGVRLDQALLLNVLDGTMSIQFDGNQTEPEDEPRFAISDPRAAPSSPPTPEDRPAAEKEK